MAFGQEVKEFIDAYTTIRKQRTSEAEARSLNEYRQAQIAASQPTALDLEEQRANIANTKRRTANIGAPEAMHPLRARALEAAIAADEQKTKYYGPKAEADINYTRARADDLANPAAKPLSPEDARLKREQADWYSRRDAPEDFSGMVDAYKAANETPADTEALPFAPTPSVSRAHSAINENFGEASNPRDVVRAAAETLVNEKPGKTQGVDDGTQPPPRNLHTGTPAPKGMIEALSKAVDPEGTMPEAERYFKAFAFAHDYFLKQGDGEKAKDAAADMLSYYRRISTQYAGYARAAAESGDIDTAVKALEKFYAFVPDGMKLDTARREDGSYQFVVTDMVSGKEVQKGVASPKDIGALAMNIGPDDFVEYLSRAAGVEVDGGDEGFTPSETEKNQEIVMSAVEGFFGRETVPEKIKTPEMQTIITDATNAISQANGGRVPPERVVEIAADMTYLDPANPTKPVYQFSDVRDGMRTVRTPGGPIKVPEATFQQLMAVWERHKQEAVLEASKAEARGNRNQTTLDNMATSAGEVGDWLTQDDGGGGPRRTAQPPAGLSAPALPGPHPKRRRGF